MSFIKYFKKVQLLDYLIRRKATGNQREFSKKVGMSRGMLNIYLNEMRELGFPITYCRAKNTYYYKEEGRVVSSLFQSVITKEEMKEQKGGALCIEWMSFYADMNLCSLQLVKNDSSYLQ